jgi:hypothetical protein
MPAVSIDTFFACALMVIAVLSAMAGTSTLLHPYINSAVDKNTAERYEEISKYLLLNSGTPLNWGQNGSIKPETFGLAKMGTENPYELDIDKVSRLNSESMQAMSYAELFTSIGLPDVAFRLEIKPVFEVFINLTATFPSTDNTEYQFEILTEKNGAPVPAYLKCYVIAENYLSTTEVYVSGGKTRQNVTISNNVHGPSLLAVLARSAYDARIASSKVYAFAHKTAEPKPRGTFLRLSPLSYVLNASFAYPAVNLSSAYALTFEYNSTLTQKASDNGSATYEIPHFLDPSLMIIALTGWNSTAFFIEWVAYPQVPVQVGADFAGFTSLSNVFAYMYVVTINSAIFECTVWVGGPRD